MIPSSRKAQRLELFVWRVGDYFALCFDRRLKAQQQRRGGGTGWRMEGDGIIIKKVCTVHCTLRTYS